MFKNKNKFITISTILSLVSIIVFLVLSLICIAVAYNPNGESLDGLAILLVILITAPCLIASIFAFAFNLVTLSAKKVWGAIVSSVITAIATLYLVYLSVDASPVIFLLVALLLAITILSIMGVITQKKLNNPPENKVEPWK